MAIDVQIGEYIKKITSYSADIYIAMAQILIAFIFSAVIILKLLDSKYDSKKTNKLICGYVIFLSAVNGMGILLNVGYFQVFAQFVNITYAVLLVIFSLIISSYSVPKTIFATLVGASINAMMIEIAMIPMAFFKTNIWISTSFFVVFMIEVVLLLYFVNKIFKSYFVMAMREIPTKWCLYAIVPTAQIIFHCLYYLNAPEKTLLVYFNIAMVNIIVLAVYWLLLYSATKIRQEDREKMNLKIYKSKVEMLEGQINTSREAENDLRIMRHDMKHYIATLKSFFDNGEIEKAKEYIGYVNQNVENLVKEQFSSNSVINACVSYYVARAREEDIDVTYNINVPNDVTKNDIELSTVIANVMENAINACKKIQIKHGRNIDITIKTQNDKLLIKFTNSCVGEVEFDENQIPITQNGIGVASVLSYAKTSNASVRFSQSGGTFEFVMIVSLYI